MKLIKIGESSLLLIVIAAIALSSGCAPKSSLTNNALTIKLEEIENKRPLDLMTLLVAPTTISDINCFAVNVTGPGVPPTGTVGGAGDNCTVSDNWHGHGVGLLSDKFARGQSVDLNVPTGSTLNFDVYGVYPSTNGCTNGSGGGGGGGDGGYFLGSKSQKITEAGTLVIPVSFVSGTPASVSCVSTGNGNSQTVPLSAGGYSSSCVAYVDPPNTPAPTGAAIGTAFTPPQLADLNSNNGSFNVSECNAATSMELAEFIFDASAYNLANYSKFQVSWLGRSGSYTAGCGGVATTAYSAGSGQVYVYKYNYGGGMTWQTVGAPTSSGTGTDSGSLQFTAPLDYAMGNKFTVRFRSPSTASANCAALTLDYIQLQLIP